MQPHMQNLPVCLQKDINAYLSNALPLCIILADNRLLPWYYEHYVQIYSISITNEIGEHEISLRFSDERAYKSVVNEIGLDYELIKGERDIVGFIDKLRLGYYVIVNVDEYYLPQKKFYQNLHFYHESLIYGYNDTDHTLSAIGFDSQWSFTTLTYQQGPFAEAFKAGLATRRYSAPVTLIKLREYRVSYPFNIDRFLENLNDYISSRGDRYKCLFDNSELLPNVNPDSWDISFGLNAFEGLVSILQGAATNGPSIIAYRNIHLMYEHKKLILGRLEYVARKYDLPDTTDGLMDSYHKIVNGFGTARLKFLKFQTAADARAIHQVIDAVTLLKAEESASLCRIYEQLQAELGS